MAKKIVKKEVVKKKAVKVVSKKKATMKEKMDNMPLKAKMKKKR